MNSFFSKIRINSIQALFMQFIKFGIVGVSNTLIALAIYYVLVYIGFHYIIANTVAFAISVLNAFFWNSKFVFKQATDSKSRQLVKVYASYGSTFLLSTGLLFVLIELIGITVYVAPLLILCINIPLNFALNKYWVFG